MTDLLEVAQCVSCGQWRSVERMQMVTVKPQEQVAYSCKPCHLAMRQGSN